MSTEKKDLRVTAEESLALETQTRPSLLPMGSLVTGDRGAEARGHRWEAAEAAQRLSQVFPRTVADGSRIPRLSLKEKPCQDENLELWCWLCLPPRSHGNTQPQP